MSGNDGLKEIGMQCTKLLKLNLRESKLAEESLSILKQHFRSLKDLNLACIKEIPPILANLFPFPSLKVLRMCTACQNVSEYRYESVKVVPESDCVAHY